MSMDSFPVWCVLEVSCACTQGHPGTDVVAHASQVPRGAPRRLLWGEALRKPTRSVSYRETLFHLHLGSPPKGGHPRQPA